MKSRRVDPCYGKTTAIARKTPPEPLRWLYSHGLIQGRALDYGSGRSCWYGMDCYDPCWRPTKLTGKYDTIVCNYVLNVVPPGTRSFILKYIKALLAPGGTAFISVRRDLPMSGKMGRGVFQSYVLLPFPSISRTNAREIYVMGDPRSNPILTTIGTSMITGVGLGLGFKTVDYAINRLKGKVK